MPYFPCYLAYACRVDHELVFPLFVAVTTVIVATVGCHYSYCGSSAFVHLLKFIALIMKFLLIYVPAICIKASVNYGIHI